MISFIIDIVVIAVLGLCTINCMKKGLVRSIIKLSGGIISFIAAALFYKPVSEYISTLKVVKNLTDSINEKIVSSAVDQTQKLPQWIENMVYSGVDTAATGVADNVSNIAVNIIAIILIYVVVRLIFMLTNFLLDNIKFAPIGALNSMGGACLGFLNGLLLIYIAMMVVFLLSTSSNGKELNEIMQSTYVAGMFYNNNVLIDLIF